MKNKIVSVSQGPSFSDDLQKLNDLLNDGWVQISVAYLNETPTNFQKVLYTLEMKP